MIMILDMNHFQMNNPYLTNRSINSLTFSKVVLNYADDNKGAYKTTKYSIDL